MLFMNAYMPSARDGRDRRLTTEEAALLKAVGAHSSPMLGLCKIAIAS